MVKHIVVYTLDPEVEKASAVEKIASLLEPLVGKIDGLLKMEIRGTYQGQVDYVLYSEFSSREALTAYQSHPLHMAAKEQFVHLLKSRVSADYEV